MSDQETWPTIPQSVFAAQEEDKYKNVTKIILFLDLLNIKEINQQN